LGLAGLAGLTGYANAQENAMQRQQVELANSLRKMQMDEITRKLRAIEQMRGQVNENMAPLVDIAPDALAKAMLPEKPQLVTVQTPQGPMQRWMRPGEAVGVDIGAPIDKEAALPWYVRRGPDGKTVIDPAYDALEKAKAANMRPPAQPMAPVAYLDTATGQVVWGTITEAKGKPAANFSPTIQGAISGAKTYGSEKGKSKAEGESELNVATSSYPQLDATVKELSALGKKATYTLVGQARDAVVRQSGAGATEGAIAREKYTQTVRDVLFPQLRATFGAQFTVKEGEALIATLGDPNKSPQEKDAALSSFIDQKKKHIETLQRKVGAEKTVIRRGKYGGKSVVEFSDGSIDYAD
jgi:hypothetical protein